jgi:1-acyl-sn-glycerol-3-phosphate acyltransferase
MIIGGSKKEVIKNIRKNITEGELNRKVEVNDAVFTAGDSEVAMKKFFSNKSKFSGAVKQGVAQAGAKAALRVFNRGIKIEGRENLKGLDLSHGAIITSNHFNPLDSFNARKVVEKVLKRKMYIVIQDTNLAMPGFFGFLMNNSRMIPLSKSPKYINQKFLPELKRVLGRGAVVLIYPEEEMWFNYRKPRPSKRGAFQFAAEMKVPVIPCFVEIQDLGVEDNDEFNKTATVMHILEPIEAEPELSVKRNSIAMAEKDYEMKKAKYEEVYGEKLDYKFKKSDIAGLR